MVLIIINVLILNGQTADVAFGQSPSGVAIRASPLNECFQKGMSGPASGKCISEPISMMTPI